MAQPDPFRELRLLSLATLAGPNYWARFSATRLDMAVGPYDEIPSSAVPGFAERMLEGLPGLIEHNCSRGERGGFLERLHEGTYAPHILEHIALELQVAAGHDVGFGRARGGDRPGEYTVAFEHRAPLVGLRAGALGLDLVRRAFAGEAVEAAPAVEELSALARDVRPLRAGWLVTGGANRALGRRVLAGTGAGTDPRAIVELEPAFILAAGVPYRSDGVLITDSRPTAVPEPYLEPDRAARLMATLVDAVEPGGVVVLPESLRPFVRDAGAVRVIGLPEPTSTATLVEALEKIPRS